MNYKKQYPESGEIGESAGPTCGEKVNWRELAVRMRTRDSSIPIDENA